jgi:haloalkane dehalogenase
MSLILRSEDHRFSHLKNFNFQPNYMDIIDSELGTMRIHFLDEGKRENLSVILLHGEPTWSYLYRKMIPILINSGLRVIAPDLIGFGKSDKPAERKNYSYKSHINWLRQFLIKLNVHGAVLFAQDWGGLLGLRILVEAPQTFDKVMIGNTGLPTGKEDLGKDFYSWRQYSQVSESFKIGNIVDRGTVRGLTQFEIDAYDAPFPDERYKSGARQFPVLVPDSINDPEYESQKNAWEKLKKLNKPFLTCFSDHDPIMKGLEKIFIELVPGAKNQDHFITKKAGHFFQEDASEYLAKRLTSFSLS